MPAIHLATLLRDAGYTLAATAALPRVCPPSDDVLPAQEWRAAEWRDPLHFAAASAVPFASVPLSTSFNTLTYTMPAATTNVPVSLGLMTWGREGVEMARVHDLAGCEKMLDVFLAHGHNEVDSALIYGEGSSEEYLGQIDWKGRGVVVDTKLAPGQYAGRDVKFTLDSMRKYIDVQLEAIKTDKFHLWYLRASSLSRLFAFAHSVLSSVPRRHAGRLHLARRDPRGRQHAPQGGQV